MRILIVEDNQNKQDNIMKYLQNRFSDASFGFAKSYSSAISKIYEHKWDLLILDMTLPTYDISNSEGGGEKKPEAGKEIMRRMNNRKIFTPTIIITQFDVFGDRQVSLKSLNEQFRQKYNHIWRGTVSYDKSNWQSSLDKLFEGMEL